MKQRAPANSGTTKFPGFGSLPFLKKDGATGSRPADENEERRNAMGWTERFIQSPGCPEFPPFETGREIGDSFRPDPFSDI